MNDTRQERGVEFGDAYAAEQIARSESGFRRRIKRHYLDRILRHVDGPTLDVGCGAGQLLARLPAGSRGLEVNAALVARLRDDGLDVEKIEPVDGRVALCAFEAGRFRTVVLSHVLEHFERAELVLGRLIDDCVRLGVRRLVIVVPGEVGYRRDPTHKTFVTLEHLRGHGLLDGPHARVRHHSYFPGNLAALGRWFVYHELMIVYEIAP